MSDSSMSPINNTINNTINTLKQRWQQLSRREQIVAATAGVAISLWLIWQLIVMPLANHQALAEKRLAASEQQLQKIIKQANAITTLRASGSKPQAFLTTPMDRVVNQTAPDFKLTVERVKSLQNGLEVALGTAPFDLFMAWLIKIEQEGGIQVTDLQINATDTPGMVEIKRLQLERS